MVSEKSLRWFSVDCCMPMKRRHAHQERAGNMFKGRMLNAANFVLPELAGSLRLLRAYSTLGRLRARSSPVKFMFEVIDRGRCLTCQGGSPVTAHLSRCPQWAQKDFISHMVAYSKVIEIACTNECLFKVMKKCLQVPASS